MKLPRVIDTLEEIQEQYQSLYEERDGKFHLMLDGETPNSGDDEEKKKLLDTVQKLRDGKAAAERRAKQNDDRLKEFEGIDPEQIKELLAKKQEDDDKVAKEKGDWETLLNNTNDKWQKKYDTDVDALREQLKARDEMVAELVEDKDLSRTQEKLRIDPERAEIWRDHIKKFMRREVKSEDGTLHVRNVVTVDDLDLDFAEWAEKHWSQRKEAEWFMLDSPAEGGGANGSGALATGIPNPWKRGEHFNRTKQSELKQTNPALARRFMQEAGVSMN